VTRLLAFLVACGHTPAPTPAPIGNNAGFVDTRPGLVAGTITDLASGDALAGATVVVAKTGVEPADNTAVLSGGDGHWSTRPLEPGTYTVVIYYADYQIEIASVIVKPGETAVVDEKLDESKRGNGDVIKQTWRPSQPSRAP
jgi:hypothetical protein